MKRFPLVLVLLGACSTYEPKPLDDRAILAEIRTLRVKVPSEGLDPAGAVALALVHNPDLRMYRRERQVAEGAVLSAEAWNNPELRLDLGSILTGNPLSLATAFRWFPELPDEGDAKIRRAKAQVARVGAEIEDREAKTAADVRIAHARAQMLDESVRLFEAFLGLQDRVVEAVRRRVDGLVSSRLDASLAALRRSEIAAELESLRSERETALADLNGLIGLPPDSRTVLRPGRAAVGLPLLDTVALEDRALGLRADLAVLKQEYEQAEQDLRLAHLKGIPWPRFLQSGAEDVIDSGGADVGLGIELPVFTRYRGSIVAAEARREQVREKFVARLSKVRAEIHGAILLLGEKERLLRHLQESAEPELRGAEDILQSVVEAGEADMLKLADLQERALRLRREVVRAKYDRLRAGILLDLAAGSALSVPR